VRKPSKSINNHLLDDAKKEIQKEETENIQFVCSKKLKRQFQAKCVIQGEKMTDVFIKFMKFYLDK
jgi:hypothetical protein